jgi:hypothetical protein
MTDGLNSTEIGQYIAKNLDESGATPYLTHLALISSPKKFIYFRLYKCACSKITAALIEDLTAQTLNHRQSIHSVKWYDEIETGLQVDKNIESVLKDPTYFKFTFVRNPYDRLLSAWKNKIDNPDKEPDGREGNRQRRKISKNGERVSFEEFVNLLYEQRDSSSLFDKHWAPQHCLLLLPFIDYDFIGKIENFNDDFEYVLKKIDAKPEIIQQISMRINQTPRTRRNDFYTDDLRDKVYEIYEKDFELFGYQKELSDSSFPCERIPRRVS